MSKARDARARKPRFQLPNGTPAAEKLEASVTKGEPGECWTWDRCVDAKGYGVLRVGKKRKFAHRVSWEAHRGVIPDGLCVCHRCDNPPCTNPEHLFLGTNADNVADMVSKGRQRGGAREGVRTKLTAADVLSIRADGRPQRVIAKDYGVSRQSISNIKTRKTWWHI